MSPDKNQEYFSDGLAEQLLNDLAENSWIARDRENFFVSV